MQSKEYKLIFLEIIHTKALKTLINAKWEQQFAALQCQHLHIVTLKASPETKTESN